MRERDQTKTSDDEFLVEVEIPPLGTRVRTRSLEPIFDSSQKCEVEIWVRDPNEKPFEIKSNIMRFCPKGVLFM